MFFVVTDRILIKVCDPEGSDQLNLVFINRQNHHRSRSGVAEKCFRNLVASHILKYISCMAAVMQRTDRSSFSSVIIPPSGSVSQIICDPGFTVFSGPVIHFIIVHNNCLVVGDPFGCLNFCSRYIWGP